jgi:hypothetical protein
MRTLREQLGKEFQKDYGYSVEWIPWECISGITFIAQGACGRVFQANWTPLTRKDGRPRFAKDSRKRTTIPVALKVLKSTAENWFEEVFHSFVFLRLRLFNMAFILTARQNRYDK